MRLIFATGNKHKYDEIIEILGEKYKDFTFSMKDLNININPNENGKTFLENASIKSKALFNEMKSKKILKQDDYIIADDTGLCIDYFNGGPGIYSARYLGKNTNQSEKNNRILELMDSVPDDKRKAYFITVLSVIEIINVQKNIFKVEYYEGRVDGYIARKIGKCNGFGYDPIFAVGSTDDIKNNCVKTYSNLGISIKNEISHRAKAMHKFVLYLEKKHNI